jgi:uncharacterized membrane protein
MFTTYLILKFIHVAAAIFWIGGVIAMMIWTVRAGAEKDLQKLATITGYVHFYGQRVVGPSSGLVLLAGIFMVLNAHISFGTLWVTWGLAGIVVHFVMAFAVFRKNAERILELTKAANPDRAAIEQVSDRQKTAVMIYVLIMLSVVFAMVTKPT